MTYSPLTLSRRHILGDLYSRCDRATQDIPVYLNDASGEKLGHVDESLGTYADAFTFHVSEDVCKGLAGGQYVYSFDYRFSESISAGVTSKRRRIKLVSIFLTMRKGYPKPVPKSAAKAEAESSPAEVAS